MTAIDPNMDEIPPNLSALIKSNAGPPNVLLIEPAHDQALPIQEAVADHYSEDRVTRYLSLGEALAENLDPFNIAVCAMDVGDASGLKVVEELLLLRPDLPIIIITDQHDHEEAAKAMREGAYDYIVRNPGYVSTIPAIIEKNLALYEVKQENARLQIQLTATLGQLRTKNEQLQGLVKDLRAIAATDGLTGIAKRRSVTQTLEQRFAHSLRHNTELAVIAIDLDGFKSLNDSAGHPAGDRVLMQLARVLSANARASDAPGRLGGDEFVVILPESDAKEASKVAKRIQDDFELIFKDLARRIGYEDKVTMSIGIATRIHARSATADDLLATADRALYRAKDAGRSCIVIEEPVA